jgi:hypothetical protein
MAPDMKKLGFFVSCFKIGTPFTLLHLNLAKEFMLNLEKPSVILISTHLPEMVNVHGAA